MTGGITKLILAGLRRRGGEEMKRIDWSAVLVVIILIILIFGVSAGLTWSLTSLETNLKERIINEIEEE